MAYGGPLFEGSLGRSPNNNIRDIGYQFYSVFSTENESRVDMYLRIQIRLPKGGPWGSRGSLGRSPNNLMIYDMLGINSTQFSALKMNLGLPHI